MDERSTVRPVQDTRRPAYGWGRILVGVFAVFGASVLIPSLTTLLRSPHEDPAVWSLNVLGGGLYILLAVCVAHNGRRMRNIGWMCLGALATMAVLIGVLTFPTPSPADLSASVWATGVGPGGTCLRSSRWSPLRGCGCLTLGASWPTPSASPSCRTPSPRASLRRPGRSRRTVPSRLLAVVGTVEAVRRTVNRSRTRQVSTDSHRRRERRELRELILLVLRGGTGRECHLSCRREPQEV